jgi:hypothetical protein
MNGKIKQFFIFFLPTIIVVLISIYSYQQSILSSDDDSSDVSIVKIELPLSNFGFNHLPIFNIPNINFFSFILIPEKNISFFTLISRQKINLININNNSPPSLYTCG